MGTSSPSRSAGAILAFLCILILTSGCQQIADKNGDARKNVVTILQSRREPSLQLWTEGTTAKRMAPGYTAAFTAMLLPSGVEMSVHTKRGPDSIQYDMKFRGKGDFTAGSAVALAGDGYFLTAAHCVDGPGNTLVAITKDKSLQKAKVRVVWAGEWKEKGPDLALIHAPLAPYEPVSLTDAAKPKRGAPVLASGLGTGRFPAMYVGQSAGHILGAGSVTEEPEGLRWRYISHTAPLAPGDSGGPLIGENRQVLGVNANVSGVLIHLWRPPLLRYRSWAVSPDPAWIQMLIEEDRRERRDANRRNRLAAKIS